jgi:hypothetical protein
MSHRLSNLNIEIDPLNSCLDDYCKFIELSPSELDSLQKGYTAELHQLQHELDLLLVELRSIAKALPKSRYLHCA